MSPPRDRSWFEQTYRAHELAVRRYAARRVGPDQADDIAAEVFAIAWRRRDDVPEAVLPWLYRTAAHVIAHEFRGRSRGASALQRHGPTVGSSTGTEAIDAQLSVDRLLAALPEGDAELLRLALWEDLDPADIAEVLGVRPATVRVRLHRARVRAQNLLAHQAGADTSARLAGCLPSSGASAHSTGTTALEALS